MTECRAEARPTVDQRGRGGPAYGTQAGPTFAFRRKGKAVAIVAGVPAENSGPLLDALLQATLQKKK